MMDSRFPRPFLIPLVLFGIFTGSCGRNSGPDLSAEVQRLNSELEAARLALDSAEKARPKKEDIGTSAAGTPAAAQEQPTVPEALPEVAGGERDAQVRTLQSEVAEFKKRGVLAFVAASSAMQASRNNDALERYQQFLKDFPSSPLAADADRAIAELTTTKERETREARALHTVSSLHARARYRVDDLSVCVQGQRRDIPRAHRIRCEARHRRR